MCQTAFRRLRWLAVGLTVSAFIAAPLASHPAPAAEGEEATGADAAEAATEEHAEPGGPIEWQTDLAAWSLVSFLLLVGVLGYFAWTPLMQALDTRESRIRQDIADAEAARHNAERMLADHERKLSQVQVEVRAILD
ncbi:MAG: ATP synthase F0 subunit B, partial [Planctomycetaceae bacterium]